MKYLLLTTLAILQLNSYAQVIINVTDKITGEKYRETPWEALCRKYNALGKYAFDFRITDRPLGTYALDVKTISSTREFRIRKGDKIALYFDEFQQPLVLVCSDNDASATRLYSQYELSNGQLDTLSKYKFNKILIQTASKSLEDSHPVGANRKLQNAVYSLMHGKLPNGEEVIVKQKKR